MAFALVYQRFRYARIESAVSALVYLTILHYFSYDQTKKRPQSIRYTDLTKGLAFGEIPTPTIGGDVLTIFPSPPEAGQLLPFILTACILHYTMEKKI